MEALSTIIISALLIGSIIAPFWLIIRSVRKREKRLESAMAQIQQQHNLHFDQHEQWNEKIIGVDTQRRWFVFLNLKETNKSEALIDLNTCESVRIDRKVMGENGKGQTTRVDLIFKKREAYDAAETITIFDEKYDDPMDSGFHHELAKKWVDIAMGQIKLRSKARL